MTGNKIKKNKKTTTLLEQLQTIIEKWNKQTKSISSTRIIQTNKQTNKQTNSLLSITTPTEELYNQYKFRYND